MKESLNKEVSPYLNESPLIHTQMALQISRLTSLNVTQKAAAEPLIRATERSHHELEMSLLELYAAGERRKAAAAQVEEARAGTLGVGGGHEYAAKVSDS